ncbi:MAG: hypothetical protein FWE36_07095 [Erysipelotrichales bacterium]|nr:hypothetical protein [Erysipelotrichales bacterium]
MAYDYKQRKNVVEKILKSITEVSEKNNIFPEAFYHGDVNRTKFNDWIERGMPNE